MEWHIGTSGWSYDAWDGRFYPEDLPTTERLGFYARYFSAVEINNTFYRLPPLTQMTKWEKSVPARFTFATKASRYITHRKKLKDPELTLPKMMELVGIQRKGGPVLFQLPPHFSMNLGRLEIFLEALPKSHRYTIEFRDPSWHNEAVYALLQRHGIAFCVFEIGSLVSPRIVTANFLYVRLHGRKAGYRGNYSDKDLTGWHRWAEDQGLDTYFFFDNTDEKLHAVENALTLKGMASPISRQGRAASS